MKKNKKSGFTLAEVLITLAIIGVVAAMTIPTLMGKYQEKALESQFKKSYAMINQAISLNQNYECYRDTEYKSMTIDNSPQSDCPKFWDSVLSSLKIVKVLKDAKNNNNIYYKTGDEVIAEGGESSLTGQPFIDDTTYNKYYLADGSVAYIATQSSYHWNSALYVVLDVNGDKGPNKWGYDSFYLLLSKETNNTVKLRVPQPNGVVEKGGKSVNEIILGTKK